MVLQDDLCFIVDLEGFFVNKTFHVQELGYYTWNEEHGHHAFFILVAYKTLSNRDKRNMNFVERKIQTHLSTRRGWTFSKPSHPRWTGQRHIQGMQWRKENRRRLQGRTCRKRLVEETCIPSLNLETLGFPKYNALRQTISNRSLLPSCSFHKDDTVHHCPVTECHACWIWYKTLLD